LGSRISRAISAATSGLISGEEPILEEGLVLDEELMGMHLKVGVDGARSYARPARR
jgi:hypothetical protein